jgi:hypothetical protein
MHSKNKSPQWQSGQKMLSAKSYFCNNDKDHSSAGTVEFPGNWIFCCSASPSKEVNEIAGRIWKVRVWLRRNLHDGGFLVGIFTDYWVLSGGSCCWNWVFAGEEWGELDEIALVNGRLEAFNERNLRGLLKREDENEWEERVDETCERFCGVWRSLSCLDWQRWSCVVFISIYL